MEKIIFTSLIFCALAASAKESSPTIMDVLNLPSENRSDILGKLDDSQYGPYLEVALDENENMRIRWRALTAAAQIRGQGATADLVKASQHKQWFIRNAALIALQQVNQKESIHVAKKLLKDKALVVRSAAVDVLQNNPNPEIRGILWGELNKDYNFKNQHSLWIRHQIVDALAKSPASHERRMFAQLLTDRDDRVQLPAVRGLQKITGVKLGQGQIKASALVGLWKEYVKKELN